MIKFILHLLSTFFLAPAIADISQSVQRTLGRDQSQYLQYNFPIEDGFTVKINISVGEITVYGSFTIRTPSSLTADFEVTSRNFIDYYISPAFYNSSVYTAGRQSQTAGSNNVYLNLQGVDQTNTFSLNTTLGDVTDGGSKSSGTCIYYRV